MMISFRINILKQIQINTNADTMDSTPLTPVTMQSSSESPDLGAPSKTQQTLKKEFEECMPELPESELRSYRLDAFNEKF